MFIALRRVASNRARSKTEKGESSKRGIGLTVQGWCKGGAPERKGGHIY